MKVLSIINEEITIGYLLYYEKSKKFYIELNEGIDPWDATIFFYGFIKRKQYSIGTYISRLWVQERVIPSDRQNINQILKDNNLKEYDLYKMLMLANGRCAQDDCYLKEIEYNNIPLSIKRRFDYRVDDVVLSKEKIICFFRNGEVKKVDLNSFVNKVEHLKSILNNPDVLKRMKVQVDGYGVEWNDSVCISSNDLYNNGQLIDIEFDDFVSFVKDRIVSTSEACKILDCSRQYINELVKQKKLHPVRNDAKNTLFYVNELFQIQRF